ncbi:site-specific integrase [Streptomyces sp. NPDC056723]|uniref:site-specific integrase n=1 Tax=Streptomyces sp. NPDC056723 TaxID=3345925 RepID=UPI0036789324
MTTRVGRPPLTPTMARAALAAMADDELLHAVGSLMLLAGLRRGEASGLLVGDWHPGPDPKLTVRSRMQERTIRVAPTVAAELDALLVGEDAEPHETRLLGLKPDGIPFMLPRLFGAAMKRAGLDVTDHDLRRAAEAVVIEDGAPMAHVNAYFGLSAMFDDKALVSVPEGYDRGIVHVLEAAFAG